MATTYRDNGRTLYSGTEAERLAYTIETSDTYEKNVFWIEPNGNEFRVIEGGWVKIKAAGAAKIVDVGIVSQRHNRTNNVITATWPGNDTFSVSWTQAEDVRRYRILVIGGADGDHVRVAEDAINEAEEEAWLTETLNNTSSDVTYLKVYTSTPDANGTFIQQWSAWQELSKDEADLSLSRLGFIASAAGPFTVFVEAE